MDGYEATRIVFSRIQSLEPENASKIMGLLLLQDHGEKEMIRLAFGPETLVHSVIVNAKKELGLTGSSRSSWRGLPSHDELISPKRGGSVLNPASIPFYANGRSPVEVADEFELQERLSLLDGVQSKTKFSGSVHGRSSSCVSDGLGLDVSDLGLGWGPCSYFARGFCKNGGSCCFIHGSDQHGVDTGASIVGSPGKIETMDTSGSCFPYSTKRMNLQQSEGQRAAVLMMGDEFQKLGRLRPLERNDLWAMASPAARQIYLTFPADSTFREEDVSNYFSTYGPVQDVRIPYQQKRMFGFVTFVYPETVKIILAKGNPHFVCDSRVLVKPYKEKGKVPDKYRTKQTTERAELSPPGGTPTAFDSRDPVDLQLGVRMLYNNTQDLLWRRKLEEHALELQSRRLMNLQLLEVKKHSNQNASPVPSPTLHAFNHTLFSPLPESPSAPFSTVFVEQFTEAIVHRESLGNKEKGDGKEGSVVDDEKLNLPESLEDSPLASPTHHFLMLDDSMAVVDNNASASSSSSSDNDDSTFTVGSESFKSLNCQMPRLSPGQGGMGILAGSGGPICPVGI